MQSGSKYGSEFLLESVTGKVILICYFSPQGDWF